MTGDVDHLDRMKVFVSYSRADVTFADQLVEGLEHSGFDPILDRHDIDAAENWKTRLGSLILSCDAVVFVLTEKSGGSPICGWEVEQAKELGKRIVPVVPTEMRGSSPPALADLNWIHFYATPAIPGSGMFDGLRKLDRALRVDLSWLREQTRLSERAAEWAQAGDEARLLRGQALTDAEAWVARAPSATRVSADVRAFLNASDIAERRRTSEAATQLAEREEALRRAEAAARAQAAALAGKEKSDRQARAVSLVALVTGVLLAVVALGLGYSAVNTTVELRKGKAALFAREADALSEQGQYAKAMLMALAGDPAAQARWETRWLQTEGFAAARSALVRAFPSTPLKTTQVYGGVLSAAFSPDGTRILTGNILTARLWDANAGQAVTTFAIPELPDGAAVTTPVSVAFSLDGTRALTGSYDGTAKLRDALTGNELVNFAGHATDVTSVAFSPDGTKVLTGSEDNTARMWDAATGRSLMIFEGHDSFVVSVAFSPDGARVLTGSRDKTAKLWDPATGAVLRTFEDHANDGFGDIYSAVFSPDGKKVLTGSNDKIAKLWDAATGKVLAAFVGHHGTVQSVAFSPDGTKVLTGSDDGTAKLWEAETGRLLANFAGEKYQVSSVLFSPDGTKVLTGGGTVKLWDIPRILVAPPQEQAALACAKLNEIGVTTFTAEDRLRFPLLEDMPDNPCPAAMGR
jgi:hypothetical protein